MPISTGTAGGMPGMQLKAWAQIGSGKTILKQFNISAVNLVTQGTQVWTFAQQMDGTEYLVRFTPARLGGYYWQIGSAVTRNRGNCTTSATSVTTTAEGSAVGEGLWEFYE